MSVVTTKSTIIGNRDATPKVLTEVSISGGNVAESEGFVLANVGDSPLSRYALCQVPSNARVNAVLLSLSAGLGTSCTLDVGVWWPTTIPIGAGLNGSTASQAINSSFFTSNQVASLPIQSTEVINGNVFNNVAQQEKQLWDALGLGADPGIMLDVCVQVHAAVAGAGGYVGLKTRYVRGD